MAQTDRKTPQECAPAEDRGPLRAIVLSSTGQDLAECAYCDLCEKYHIDGMDLSIGELIRAAKQNDSRVLSSRTLWLADQWIERGMRCQAGLDLSSILLALQREALARGIVPNVDVSEGELSTTGAKSE